MVAPDTKAIIFDCFGVLSIDSETSLLDHVRAERHQELADLFTSNNYGYHSRAEYLEQVAAIADMTVNDIEAYFAHEHRLNQPLVTLIKSLRPQYRIGLLSNIGKDWINDFFDQHALHDLFDQVVLSGEEGVVKPQRAIYELAAARLGIAPSSCLMIDDILRNCQGAEDAGMSSLQFKTNAQLLDTLRDRRILMP